MGCKYKHEMPTDKATQMSLGLNHGVPAWYRRAFGALASSPSPAQATIAGSPLQSIQNHPRPSHHGNSNMGANNRLEGSWRNPQGPSSNMLGPLRQIGGVRHGDYLHGSAREFIPTSRQELDTDLLERGGENNSVFGAIAPPRMQPYSQENNTNRFARLKNEEDEDEDEEDEVYVPF